MHGGRKAESPRRLLANEVVPSPLAVEIRIQPSIQGVSPTNFRGLQGLAWSEK